MQPTETLWNEFHTRLQRFVARRVANQADVDDIVQDVFLRVHQKIDTLEESERLHAWVYQIARNAITDYYRSPRRRREEQMDGVLADILPGDEEPEDDVIQEIAGCVAPILQTLPEAHREALLLTEIDGLTQLAAARQLGVSHSGMKSRVQRARRQMKDALLNCCEIELDRRGGIINYTAQQASCDCCDDCRASEPATQP